MSEDALSTELIPQLSMRDSVRRAGTVRYRIESELASGGMGVVHRAIDRASGEPRALKRLRAGGQSRAADLLSFEREYQVLASLDHPRIIRTFDYGVDDEGPYYAMELIDGQDMHVAAPLPYREVCLYLRDLATCLALLHARRLLHRDLSPSNVRMTTDGHCKLLDFGALLGFGKSDSVVGTPPMVPPEALEGAPLDQRADLFSLGALAYWMLTGSHAYPAQQIKQLSELWSDPPVPPSSLVRAIPSELDLLVLSLLSIDPLARPSSAAEVIARLSVIGELPEEANDDADRLAQSFLLNPSFTGRAAELHAICKMLEHAVEGSGRAAIVAGSSGSGRTRLLDEIAVRAQLAGATVLRADASMCRFSHGTARALIASLLDAWPDVAREHGARHRAALRALGGEVEVWLEGFGGAQGEADQEEAAPATSLDAFLFEVSRRQPLAVLVDNVEYADDASLGLLASLAKLCATEPLLVVVSERSGGQPRNAVGLATLRSSSERVELCGLNAAETLELSRSLFGDAPDVERFAGWLFEATAGSPLFLVELVRHLVAKRVIHHTSGIWTLPIEWPAHELPLGVEEALFSRVQTLSCEARSLAEGVSLLREEPTFKLCRLLCEQADERAVLALLDELARNDVMYPERESYRFSSTALRDVLLSHMSESVREQHHRRLGEALAQIAGESQPALRIEAGWHLILGGDDLRGADMVAQVTADSVTIRDLLANMHRAGHPLEAALGVYCRYRRSIYERLPLLSALAQAGYYDDRVWADRYGDAALDLLEHVSGLGTARALRRYLGRHLSLALGLLVAFIRFQFVAKKERPYSFETVLVQLFGAVTTLTGTATLLLDGERARHVASVIEPFSALPERQSANGIHRFCEALAGVRGDNQAITYAGLNLLIQRFEDAKYYPDLPRPARRLFIAGLHFSRGSYAIHRADGRAALESADALDRSGLKLYAMIASQLRFLYHMNRGEFALAKPHREQLELHASHLGTIWQAEIWEAPALIVLHSSLSDVVSCTRVARRLELLSQSIVSLKRYARIAQQAMMQSRHDPRYAEMVSPEYEQNVPRSFIGWAATCAFLAKGYNRLGKHAEAKQVAERTLSHVEEADREFVSYFLELDIQAAIADAGLGDFRAALSRIEKLLERFADCDHPLVLGLLHEARACISFSAGNLDDYEHSLMEVERWFCPTGTPALIARFRRLTELEIEMPANWNILPPLRSSNEPPPPREPAEEPNARAARTNLDFF